MLTVSIGPRPFLTCAWHQAQSVFSRDRIYCIVKLTLDSHPPCDEHFDAIETRAIHLTLFSDLTSQMRADVEALP